VAELDAVFWVGGPQSETGPSKGPLCLGYPNRRSKEELRQGSWRGGEPWPSAELAFLPAAVLTNVLELRMSNIHQQTIRKGIELLQQDLNAVYFIHPKS